MLERVVINEIDITEFKHHPRLLELRFVATYDRWYKEFGERADGILLGLATAFQCDIAKLRAVANQSPAIRKITKGDRIHYVQESIIAGLVWKESRMFTAERFLRLSKRTLYANPDYIPSRFVTAKWLARLDTEIVACGLKQYANEIERFLESLEALREIL